MKLLLTALSLLLLFSSPSFAQTSLTNKDVIDLVKAGLSAEIVAAKIRASKTHFDTSPTALAELKREGVPDSVVLVMLEPVKAEPTPAPEKRYVPLGKVKRIQIGRMGNGDDSERFRLLLKDRLQEKGFTVVDSEDEADAILTGALATQLSEGTTKARASVTLKAPNGTTLWSDDFGVRMAFGLGRRDSVKLRADDVADGIKSAWKKAQKSSHQ